jgi:tRNA(Ile)-lysidine synthase
MRHTEFFHAGQRLGVAVSGGPDSVLLLHFLKLLAHELGYTLAAVHFNHHLRGAESDGDEAFVRGLAAALEVDYLRGEADVARVARVSRRNVEAVARDLRYRYFFSLIGQGRLDRVATAHTASDQAETVLLRLLRGTGTRGLGGIYPVLDGKVVRPFLSLTRGQVMQEIAKRQLEFRVDSSNLNRSLRRNKVRMELLPLLERKFNPQIVPLLKQLADLARDDEACLERLARERAEAWRVREGGEERIAVRPLLELPPALVRRVLRQMLECVRGSLVGLTQAHVEALRRFAVHGQSGKAQMLPGGVLARKEFSWLALGLAREATEPADFSYRVVIPGELSVPETGSTFRFKILNRGGPGKAYNQRIPAGLDPQKLPGELLLRNWRAGDSYRPLGGRSVRKLKELFRERKVPAGQRRNWPVLECEGQIVWARGFPPAGGVAASDAAPRVLTVEEEVSL